MIKSTCGISHFPLFSMRLIILWEVAKEGKLVLPLEFFSFYRPCGVPQVLHLFIFPFFFVGLKISSFFSLSPRR